MATVKSEDILYSVHGSSLTAIGDAIRGKTGGTDSFTLEQMVTEIEGIQSGGGESAQMFASSAIGILPTVYKGTTTSEFMLDFESSAVGALQEE